MNGKGTLVVEQESARKDTVARNTASVTDGKSQQLHGSKGMDPIANGW